MIAGERDAPLAYKRFAAQGRAADRRDRRIEHARRGAVVRTESYRPELTPVGRQHPIFRFSADDQKNEEIWNTQGNVLVVGRLRAQAGGGGAGRTIRRPRGRPTRSEGDEAPERQPLVVTQFVGAGRGMFFGFNETWRWGFREDQVHYNQFWIQTMRIWLAKPAGTHVDLRLDRQTPYRRGEPIKVDGALPRRRAAAGRTTPRSRCWWSGAAGRRRRAGTCGRCS